MERLLPGLTVEQLEKAKEVAEFCSSTLNPSA